jgi:hypothetical protein
MSGEINTASNLGAGIGIFESKSGVNLRFKSFNEGNEINLTPGVDTVTISTTAQNNIGLNLGLGEQVFDSKIGSTFRFRTLTEGARITLTSTADEIAIATTAEVNAAANFGVVGTGIYKDKLGSTLRFRPLIQGANMTITTDGDTITLASASPGEINTVGTLGGGESVYGTKVGSELRFKSLVEGTNVTLSSTANEVTIDATHSLNNHTDVTITAPTDRQYLMYESGVGKFINSTVSMGSCYWEDNVTVTTTPLNVWTKVAGTTTALMQKEFNMPVTNRLEYTGAKTKHFHIVCQFSVISAGANDRSVEFSFYKNGSRIVPKLAGNAHSGRPSSLALHTDVMLATNDYLELFMRNISTSDNMTVTQFYFFLMGL